MPFGAPIRPAQKPGILAVLGGFHQAEAFPKKQGYF